MAHLPISRIKTIMKTTDGTDSISKDAIFLTTRAAELFIKKLASEAHANMKNGKVLSYNNLVNVVHSNSQYDFLEYMIPKKITVQMFKDMMAKRKSGGVQSSSEESEEDDDEVLEDKQGSSTEKPEIEPETITITSNSEDDSD